MSFTYDLTTDIGKVRLLIQDTAIKTAQFTDAEITAFLTMSGDVVKVAAIIALESWAGALSDNPDSEKIGDYSYSKKAAANKLTLADKYREEVDSTPVIDWAEMDLTEGSGITEEED